MINYKPVETTVLMRSLYQITSLILKQDIYKTRTKVCIMKFGLHNVIISFLNAIRISKVPGLYVYRKMQYSTARTAVFIM